MTRPKRRAPAEPAVVAGDAEQPRFSSWMGSMWLYTLLRFGLFFVLWGVLYLVGLRDFVAPLVALLLSVPLSFVLLARPRARFAHQLELRVNARHEQRAQLDEQLDPGARSRDL